MNRPRLQVKGAVFGERMLFADRLLTVRPEDLIPDITRALGNDPDAFEWRIDYLEGYTDPDTSLICGYAKKLAELAGDIPIIFTPRHPDEKGVQAIDDDAKFALIEAVAATGTMGLFDIERRYGRERISRLLDTVHSGGARLIISHHDFDQTHTAQELYDMILELQSWGADIVKFIGRAHNVHEFVSLIDMVIAGREKEEITVPLILGAGSDMGPVMRVFGEFMCNDLTFVDSYEEEFPRHLHINDIRRLRELVLGK
ncbi:MAG: type I 3-dehydroquinate dehydratase [Lachnospiraceae bacterium]|nr:type I 3-dehydroquinate dehydratase [Lachnospiraceae bacterium]